MTNYLAILKFENCFRTPFVVKVTTKQLYQLCYHKLQIISYGCKYGPQYFTD